MNDQARVRRTNGRFSWNDEKKECCCFVVRRVGYLYCDKRHLKKALFKNKSNRDQSSLSCISMHLKKDS